MAQESKAAVRGHWEAEPCGSTLARAEPGTRKFYAQVEAERYRLEPFIPDCPQTRLRALASVAYR